MATYDIMASVPESVPCECCGNIVGKTFYFTISGRIVCSNYCAQNLPPSPEDSCYICWGNVWEDEFYATQTKYFCSAECKDIYLNNINQNESEVSSYPELRQGRALVANNRNCNCQQCNLCGKFYNEENEVNIPGNPFFENESTYSGQKKVFKGPGKNNYIDTFKDRCDYWKREIDTYWVIFLFNWGHFCTHGHK